MKRLILIALTGALCAAASTVARAQEAGPRPDLLVRRLELNGKHLVTVYVLNQGKADAVGCYVTLSGTDSSETKWNQRYDFGPVARGATSQMVFDISPHVAEPGTSLRADIDSGGRVAEENEANNTRFLRVPDAEVSGEPPAKPAPTPAPAPPSPTPPTPKPPPPAPKEKPLISPDIAAADIYFDDKFVVAVLKNVGDRDYYAKDAKIKDSFKRVVTLKRIVHVGATSYTEDLKTRTMGNARVGEAFNGAYPRPKRVPGARKYTWILTIEGDDPDMKNNTCKKVQQVTKID